MYDDWRERTKTQRTQKRNRPEANILLSLIDKSRSDFRFHIIFLYCIVHVQYIHSTHSAILFVHCKRVPMLLQPFLIAWPQTVHLSRLRIIRIIIVCLFLQQLLEYFIVINTIIVDNIFIAEAVFTVGMYDILKGSEWNARLWHNILIYYYSIHLCTYTQLYNYIELQKYNIRI